MFEKERFEQVDEWAEAPLQEPERQYYYMKKCRLKNRSFGYRLRFNKEVM